MAVGSSHLGYGTKTGKSGITDIELGCGFEFVDKKASTITVHDICYEVDVKRSPCCGKTTRKIILKEIHAIFKPGMNAILGPTGSGKSSLLDVLAGRKNPKGLTGHLLIDGCPPPENFKCMVGYVVQDDVVMGTLTVRENFEFSAALRLPSSVTKQERKLRIDQVIQELGLTKCADTKVGNEFIRGISGGERKRTNIGMELITSPPVLFLDEPTTGLDANTANSVLHLLRRMAVKGQTIIFSIHQPRYSIFKLFDRMVLLSLGETIYHGPGNEALDFFNTLGYVCEEHNNPSDFFLDVINGDTLAQLDSECQDVETIVKAEDDHEEEVHQKLVNGFLNSPWHERLMEEIKPISDAFKKNVDEGTLVSIEKVEYATSFLTQLVVVSGRSAKNLIRNPQTSVMQVVVMIIFALIIGTVYFRLDREQDPSAALQNRSGVFFFMVMNQIFSNLSAVELFIKERAIFMHENVSGFYRVSAYFAAKVFFDVIPMRLVPLTVYTVIAYWMIGLRAEAGHFFFFYLNLFLTNVTAASVAFFVSSGVRIFAVANLLIALFFVFMMLFGGLLVNLNTLGDWLSWVKWLSLFKYSLDALSINELKDQTFCETSANGTKSCLQGNKYLDRQGIAYQTQWDVWQKEVALGAMIVIMLTLAYIQLLRMKKLR